MSGWVDAYPLDESTAVYREELNGLHAMVARAIEAAESAQRLLTWTRLVVNANSSNAPVTYGAVTNALGIASVGPRGTVPLVAATESLAGNLRMAREIYSEAEWTLIRVLEAYEIDQSWIGTQARNAFRHPVGGNPAEIAAVVKAIIELLEGYQDGMTAVELQAQMRETAAYLRELMVDFPWDLQVHTRDGVQHVDQRAPVQGAALLLVAWLNLAMAVQAVTLRQVPAVGAATAEMETAVIPAIDGIPEALGWVKDTRSLSHDTGRVSLVSKERPDGTRAWTVLIPGTQTWDLGVGNPQDLESNLEMTAGLSSELVAAVVAAVRAAPIGRGESITLVGHSQGGIVASAIASDPRLRKEFSIRAVVTAGSPVGQFNAVPDAVRSLHLEDINDITPGVDGLANTASATHVTLVFDPEIVSDDPHGHDNYAALVETVLEQGSSPELERMAAEIAAISGWGDGGDARLYTYEFERDQLSPSLNDQLAKKILEGVR